MDKENLGYDFVINYKSTNKDAAIKDAKDVAQAIREWDEKARANMSKMYESKAKKQEKRNIDYMNNATKRMHESFVADPSSIKSGDVADLKKKIFGMSNTEATSNAAMGNLDKLDDIHKKVRDNTKEINRNKQAWYMHHTATRKARASLYLLGKKFGVSGARMQQFGKFLGSSARGLQRMSGGIQTAAKWLLALATAAVYTGVRIFNSLTRAGEAIENLAQKSQVFMGSMKNTYAAIDFAQEKLIQGKSAWSVENVMGGMRTLGEVGVDAKKHYNLIADMAGKTGHSFEETSAAINSAIKGNSSAFESFGIQELHLRGITGALRQNTPAMRNAILGYLANQKMFKGGAEEMNNTLQGQKTQLKGWWDYFKQTIVGRANDPTSLYSSIKNTFKKVNEFLMRNKDKIAAIAKGIGQVFKWLWAQVDGILSRIMRKVDGMSLTGIQKTFKNLIVWLELTKMKVMRIFDEWGWAFKAILGIWAAGKVAGAFTTLISWIKTAWTWASKLWDIFKFIGNGLSGISSTLAPLLSTMLTALLVLKPQHVGTGDTLDAHLGIPQVKGRSGYNLSPAQYNVLSRANLPGPNAMTMGGKLPGSSKLPSERSITPAQSVQELYDSGYRSWKDMVDYVKMNDDLNSASGTFSVGAINITIGDASSMTETDITALGEAIKAELERISTKTATRAGS